MQPALESVSQCMCASYCLCLTPAAVASGILHEHAACIDVLMRLVDIDGGKDLLLQKGAIFDLVSNHSARCDF
jgi:hypothetical protein